MNNSTRYFAPIALACFLNWNIASSTHRTITDDLDDGEEDNTLQESGDSARIRRSLREAESSDAQLMRVQGPVRVLSAGSVFLLGRLSVTPVIIF